MFTDALLQLAVLGVPSALIALLLRWSGAPGGRAGAALTSGILVGIFAGPNVLGARWPGTYDRLFRGGVSESNALRQLEAEHRREMFALTSSGVSGTALEELRTQQRVEREPIVQALHTACAIHIRSMDQVTLGALALALFGVSLSVVGSRKSAMRIIGAATFQAPISAAIFLVAALAPPTLAVVLSTDLGITSGLAFALTIATTGASVALGRHDAPTALFVSLFAAIAVGALMPTAGALAMGAATVIGILCAMCLPCALRRTLRQMGAQFAYTIAIPAVVALLAVRFDLRALASEPTSRFAFWFTLIVAIIWSSDGRMLAWWLALRPLKWSVGQISCCRWTTAARMVNTGSDVFHLALLTLFFAGGLFSDAMAAGALFGCALLALTGGARTFVARILDVPRAA